MATAGDVMNRHPVAIHPDGSAADAARMMAVHQIGMLPVVRDGGVIGIVTDRDLVLRVLAAGLDPATTRISDVASDWVATVTPETALDRVELVIEERRVRRIPVVSSGRLVGIVSQSDIARRSPGASPHTLEPATVWLE